MEIKKLLGIIITVVVGFSLLTCKDSANDYTPPSVLTGTVTIFGIVEVGQTLTANTDNLGGNGTITYQWRGGETNIGTNSRTYSIQNADVGSTITVTVTRSDNSGSITSEPVLVTNSGIIFGSSTIKLYLNNNNSPLQEGGSNSVSRGTGTFTVSISSGNYSEIVWYLNGTIISKGTSNTSIVLSRRTSGTFHITVEVTIAGEKNTGNYFFIVN